MKADKDALYGRKPITKCYGGMRFDSLKCIVRPDACTLN